MGFSGGNEIFDSVADKLIELSVSDEIKTEVLDTLIKALFESDWDTEDESLDTYAHDSAIVEAFRRNSTVFICFDETDTSEVCELALEHDGLHQNYTGTVQW